MGFDCDKILLRSVRAGQRGTEAHESRGDGGSRVSKLPLPSPHYSGKGRIGGTGRLRSANGAGTHAGMSTDRFDVRSTGMAKSRWRWRNLAAGGGALPAAPARRLFWLPRPVENFRHRTPASARFRPRNNAAPLRLDHLTFTIGLLETTLCPENAHSTSAGGQVSGKHVLRATPRFGG